MLRYTVRWIQYVFLIANCFSRDTPHFEFRFRKACHVAVKIVAPSPRTNFKRTSRLLIRERDEKNGFVRECLGRNEGREGGLWSASNRVGKQFRRVLPRLQPSDYQWTPTCAGSITHVLHSLSLSLSLFSSRACLVPCARLIYQAFSKRRRRRGNRVAITDDRTKRDRRNGWESFFRRAHAWKQPCGEIEEMEDCLLKRWWGKRWTEERIVIIRFLSHFLFRDSRWENHRECWKFWERFYTMKRKDDRAERRVDACCGPLPRWTMRWHIHLSENWEVSKFCLLFETRGFWEMIISLEPRNREYWFLEEEKKKSK